MSNLNKINVQGVNYDLEDTTARAAAALAVTNVDFDNTNKKITQTINGTTTDVVKFAQSGDITVTASGDTVTIGHTELNQTVKGNGTAFGASDAVDLVPGTGLTVTADTTNDKITFGHSNSVDAGTASEGGISRTLAYGGSFNVPSVTYDAQGHITGKGSVKLTLPASDEKNQKVKAGSVSFGDNDTVGFVGSGSVSVAGNATDKTITITGVDNNQTITSDDGITFGVNDAVKITAGAGISAAGDADAKTITVAHTNSVTAGTAGPTAAQTPGYGATFNVPYVTYDAQGHITAAGTNTVKIPASDNTIGKNIVGASATAKANASATNGNVYLNHIENGAVQSAHKISGSGSTTVTSDTSGNITVSCTDTNQKVKAGTTTFDANDVVNFVGGSGLTVTGDNATSGSESITIAHSNSVDAGTAGTTSAQTPGYGSTFNIPYVTYDAQGHITGSGNSTVKIPASDNTNQTVGAGTVTFGSNDLVKFVGSGSTTVTGSADDKTITISSSYVNDNQTVTAGSVSFGKNDAVNYVAGNHMTVTGDATNKKITIAHADTSSQASVSNTGRTYIQSITLDGDGHVTALSSGTESVVDTNQTVKVGSTTFGSNTAVEFAASGSASVTAGTDKITIGATDTKNTAGSTNNAAKKMYVIGAESQAANPQTYSNANVYIGTDNELYANGKKLAHYEDLAKAVIFRGTLGTSGTITALPQASADTEGDMYRVITAGSYTAKDSAGTETSYTTKVGDMFICGAIVVSSTTTYTWIYVPSSEASAGTVTNIATGTGLTGGPITTSGTISLATAYGDSQNPYASKTKNYVLAAPNGSAGVPSFRALVAADIPNLTLSKITDVTKTVAEVNKAFVYQGTLGTSGTITSLPTTADIGDAYKVITAGTYGGKYCKVGDFVVNTVATASSATWEVLAGPSSVSGTTLIL